MLETSQDLLYLILSVSVLLLTVFLVWFMYYLIIIVKNIYIMVQKMKGRINKLDEIIDLIKTKIEHSVSNLFLIGEGVKKLVQIIKEKKTDKL
ncbi:MAG: hypothetical protein V1768_00510 [Patescibacteria group bacterium]|nr:hypothetical protein [Patescibacteria group bacterium]MBU1160764.1 hypothetical protein [Patescibacteria group bacterium]MBU1350160.1 hypothetical protein [Patescibacteria group bacterium]MBU1421100.1 hypothetical protein [Patescibacteria group bacterium]MBU1987275.1 hypothetical protein [Patescibacteria group bacterium]